MGLFSIILMWKKGRREAGMREGGGGEGEWSSLGLSQFWRLSRQTFSPAGEALFVDKVWGRLRMPSLSSRNTFLWFVHLQATSSLVLQLGEKNLFWNFWIFIEVGVFLLRAEFATWAIRNVSGYVSKILHAHRRLWKGLYPNINTKTKQIVEKASL